MTDEQLEIIKNICKSWGSRFYYIKEDILSEAILKCLEIEKRHPYHPNKTGLFIIKAQGSIKDLLLKEKRQKELIDNASHDYTYIIGIDEIPIEAYLDDMGFTEYEKFIVEQRLASYTLLEISNQTGHSKSTIRKTLTNIRKKIIDD